MAHSIVRMNVLDYAKWRASFDAVAAARRALGATGNNQIYRDRDNPNTVTAILEWEDEKKAREWFQSPALKEAQQKAGVTGVLEMHVLERV
jgi:heme-degrading monooxygenase HmoA